jgi:hypothetical protein
VAYFNKNLKHGGNPQGLISTFSSPAGEEVFYCFFLWSRIISAAIPAAAAQTLAHLSSPPSLYHASRSSSLKKLYRRPRSFSWISEHCTVSYKFLNLPNSSRDTCIVSVYLSNRDISSEPNSSPKAMIPPIRPPQVSPIRATPAARAVLALIHSLMPSSEVKRRCSLMAARTHRAHPS